MSRSYHSNHRKYINEKKNKYSDDDVKYKRLSDIREEVLQKRATKKNTLLSRKTDIKSISFGKYFDPSSIEIRILDEGQYIHYPAQKEDFIGVIRRLPYNVVSGIHSITLCLGKEYQEDNFESLFKEEERDPFTSRICGEDEGVIFTPPILGTYYIDKCKIFIYAYVYNKEKFKFDIIEPLLKLKMLKTLVHEIAHHEDNMIRTNGRKWLGFNSHKCEYYAELQETKWAETVIVPYLMDNYSEEYNALSNWIEENGGVRLTLEKLACEDISSLLVSASSAVKDLFENVIKGMSSRDRMLQFAQDLHYGDYFHECLKSLDTILSNNPKDSEVLGVKADTYIHIGKYDEAEQIANECLLIDNTNTDALEVLCDVNRHRKDWKGLKHTCKLGIEVAEDDFRLRSFIEMYIVCLLYLKDYEEANKYLDILATKGNQEQKNLAFEALVKVCSGDIETALNIVNRVLLSGDKVYLKASAILRAINNYLAISYDKNIKKYEISEFQQNYLKFNHIISLLQ